MVAVMVGAITMTALYASFTFGYGTVRAARENLRGTQILMSKLETLRLSAFTNIQNSATTTYYNPSGVGTNNGGTVYTITFTNEVPGATDLQSPVYYRGDMRR